MLAMKWYGQILVAVTLLPMVRVDVPHAYAISAQTTSQSRYLSVPVRVAPVRLLPIPTTVRALGMVDSLGQTTLVATKTGEVEGPFDTKGEVAAGSVVARDVSPALQGQIDAARAQLASARIILRRTAQLVREHLQTDLQTAVAQRNLAQAKSSLATLRQQAHDQVMRAPFAGTLHYLVAPGTVVYHGTPVARISGRASPWVDIEVPPAAASEMKVDEAAVITRASWRGFGRVLAVGQDARPWGLIRVRIGLPKRNLLIPGEWIRVRLTHQGAPTPAVPRAAVVMRGTKATVFVVAHRRALAVQIHVIANSRHETWVAGALRPGESVVVVGVTRLKNGARVNPDSEVVPD